MDYRKFLGKKSEALVLPYVGGLSVHAPDRRLRLHARTEVGWWTFDVEGRYATPREKADAPEITDRPRLRGHLVGWWLFTAGNEVQRLQLAPPDEQPAAFTPATGRRWYDGTPLFEGIEFDDEAEMAVRLALEEGTSIDAIKGIAPSLRAAYGYARLVAAGRERSIDVSPLEALAALPGLADGSSDPAAVAQELQARRFQLRPDFYRAPPPRRQPPTDPTIENAEARAADVLQNAGAVLLSSRLSGSGQLEVTFRFLGERFICIVDWLTLHVYDSGICLEGADEMLGLDALPSVIQEAIRNDELHITRR